MPVNQLARRVLSEQLAKVFRDTIIRVIAKVSAAKAAGLAGKKAGGEEHGQLLGWLLEQAVSGVMQATEEADKRIWTTLPGQIEMARIWIKPGHHRLGSRCPTVPNR